MPELHRWVRTLARRAVYATPARRLLPQRGKAQSTQAYWDRELAGGKAAYLGGTVSVECRNALTLALVRMTAPEARSILDVACAGGTLGTAPGSEPYTYVGTDISQYAVDQARKRAPARLFHCADLKTYVPGQAFDVICFNEVLYYLTPEENLAQLIRYSASLSERGVFVVGMKNDPKSTAIFRVLEEHFPWIDGMLYQEKNLGHSYRITENAQRPAYLLGVFGGKRR